MDVKGVRHDLCYGFLSSSDADTEENYGSLNSSANRTANGFKTSETWTEITQTPVHKDTFT